MCYTIASCGISSSSFFSVITDHLIFGYNILQSFLTDDWGNKIRKYLIYFLFFTRCHCLAIANCIFMTRAHKCVVCTHCFVSLLQVQLHVGRINFNRKVNRRIVKGINNNANK